MIFNSRRLNHTTGGIVAKRSIEGVLHALGGQVFGFFETTSPYDIPGCAALMRRAKGCSSSTLGNITVKLFEFPSHPDTQGFAVLSDRRGVKHDDFEALIPQLFPGCKIEKHWVKHFDSGQLFLALVVKEALGH